MMKRIFLSVLLAAPVLAEETPRLPRVVGGGDVKEVLWVRLDRNDLMLESLTEVIREHGIRDGAVLSGVGGLDACKFHGVNGTMTAVEEPVELLHLAGLIADGKPHLHIVVSNKAKGAFGGHLEDGCRVMSQVEIAVARFKGPAMTRKRNGPTGPTALQKK